MSTKPWDLLNPNEPRSSQEISEYRMSICRSCPEFFALTNQCKKCKCIMPLKTRLSESECPIGKWNKVVD